MGVILVSFIIQNSLFSSHMCILVYEHSQYHAHNIVTRRSIWAYGLGTGGNANVWFFPTVLLYESWVPYQLDRLTQVWFLYNKYVFRNIKVNVNSINLIMKCVVLLLKDGFLQELRIERSAKYWFKFLEWSVCSWELKVPAI